jgi:hypothetical protein
MIEWFVYGICFAIACVCLSALGAFGMGVGFMFFQILFK